MEYQLLTDSCCDLPLEIMDQYDIDVMNFTIHMEGEELIDDMGRTFDKAAFFERLKNGATASTSQVNVHTYLEKFKYYIEKGIPLLYLGFSSGLSGSFNSARQALQMLKEEYDDPKVTIIDTQAASLGEGLLVYEVAKRKAQGASLEEVIKWVEDNKGKVHSWVTVDDIGHLKRGGRISATQATLGSLLNVKPIIVMTKEGKLVPNGKVRGRKKSLQKLIDETVNGIVDPENQTLFVGHVGVPDDAAFVKGKLESALPVKEVKVSSYGPTVAAHTGFGSLAIFSLGKERTLEA
jgi:DegV family protein with EDD domain